MSDEFLKDVAEGFSKTQKSLPAKWLYDRRGSELFEAITKTEDYYVTRTEAAIMRTVLSELPARCPHGSAITEFGSGAGVKSRRLIDAMMPSVYVMIDVAEDFLNHSVEALSEAFEDVTVSGVVGDFNAPVTLPPEFHKADNRMGFFPGSTIGNFQRGGAQIFLENARKVLGDGSMFLLGVDLVKDEDVLVSAYDDSDGMTARFTLNLLERMNRELDADFDLETFRHQAKWNLDERRIEIRAVSLVDQSVTVGGETYSFAEGEGIHTENSHKYTRESFGRIADAAGWQVEAMWTDPKEWFGVFLLNA
ncbi:MAG: L-histidine N(alpha)-methyltransferase [Pseudomonadota bacterium]